MEKALQDLEADDLAYMESRHGNGIVKIDRITKTQIITTEGSKYRICDGSLIGSNMYNRNVRQGNYLTIEKKS